MKLWKRNAVVAAIVLFVCVAVYLNWSYSQDGAGETADTGKVLGEAALVGGKATDPLLKGENASSPAPSESPAAGEEGQSNSSGYFASARLNRQQARDNALELLQEAAADDEAEQTVIDDANQSIQTMAAYTLSEAQVENLVVAKGYEDCICFINENSASVVVASTESGLTDTDIARIAEIVTEETGLSVSQVKIIEADP